MLRVPWLSVIPFVSHTTTVPSDTRTLIGPPMVISFPPVGSVSITRPAKTSGLGPVTIPT